MLITLYLLFDETAIQFEYTHRPLEEQFESLGIRQIELDVYADPMGGLYAAPFGFQWLLYDFEARISELEAPGIKVLHVPELDYDTTCQTLVECLEVVKDWSDARPGRLPIMILIEAKDDLVPDPLDLDFTVPIEFGPAEFDDLDAEIRSVFPPSSSSRPTTCGGVRQPWRRRCRPGDGRRCQKLGGESCSPWTTGVRSGKTTWRAILRSRGASSLPTRPLVSPMRLS